MESLTPDKGVSVARRKGGRQEAAGTAATGAGPLFDDAPPNPAAPPATAASLSPVSAAPSRFAAVAILDAPATSPGVYDYSVPDHLDGLGLGTVVVAPLRGRLERGVVVDLPPEPAVRDGLKAVHSVATGMFPVSPEFLDLGRWMAHRYVCSLGRCLSVFLPPMRSGQDGRVVARRGRPRFIYTLAVPPDAGRKALAAMPARSSARRRALEALLSSALNGAPAEGGAPAESGTPAGRGGVSAEADPKLATALKWLIQQGLASRTEEQTRPDKTPEGTSGLLVPTTEQSSALERLNAALAARRFSGFLLHGITGSGKTEVYRWAAAASLGLDRAALILVPEIALTPQAVDWFRAAFQDQVAILHSRLSAGERAAEWERVRTGQARVVVGARLAAFAPIPDLGLVVVDEEQEGTYHQEEDPKYDAREVARWRAERHGAVLMLGSATPSIETVEACHRGELGLLELKRRVDGRQLPAVAVIDLREELKAGNRGVFSRALREALARNLERGEQAILFLNRRGYNAFVLCRNCGYVARCPHCEVSLTLHEDTGLLTCHYCDHQEAPPAVCPHCGSKAIRGFGTGTERVAAEVIREFPRARVLRLDLDTTSTKGAHGRIVRAFRRREADILVGTQMVAKGLDFPGVTLVGIVAADLTLNLPDFRSAERTFQLLVQAAGRAGRGDRAGRVIIQTYSPEHYAVGAAAAQDSAAFLETERRVRADLRYPPFAWLARALFSSPSQERAAAAAVEALRKLDGLEVEALGPSPAPLSRLKDRHRIQVVLRAPDGEPLREAGRLMMRLAGGRGWDSRVDFSFEMDPRSIL